MSKAFNDWWNGDELSKDNLHAKDTPAYWAWEGWVAAIAALHQALEQTKQEQKNNFNPDWDAMAVMVKEQQRMAKRIEELEASTPQPGRKWVGLTNNEVWNVLQFRGYNSDTIKIAKAIQAALKKKNT